MLIYQLYTTCWSSDIVEGGPEAVDRLARLVRALVFARPEFYNRPRACRSLLRVVAIQYTSRNRRQAPPLFGSLESFQGQRQTGARLYDRS